MALQGGNACALWPGALGESTHEVTSVTRTINPVKGVRFSGRMVESAVCRRRQIKVINLSFAGAPEHNLSS